MCISNVYAGNEFQWEINLCMGGGKMFLFFRPWQCVLSSVFIGDSGEWKWQETSINMALKAESKALKRLPFLRIFYPFGF